MRLQRRLIAVDLKEVIDVLVLLVGCARAYQHGCENGSRIVRNDGFHRSPVEASCCNGNEQFCCTGSALLNPSFPHMTPSRRSDIARFLPSIAFSHSLHSKRCFQG